VKTSAVIFLLWILLMFEITSSVSLCLSYTSFYVWCISSKISNIPVEMLQ